MSIFRTWMRVVAAWVASIYVIGHLGSFLHTTLERHVVCAEHGHLVHADESGDADHVEESTSGHQWRGALAGHADHEHCPALTVLKPLAKPATALWVELQAPYRTGTWLAPRVSATPIRGPTVAILRLAPKTSPPTA